MLPIGGKGASSVASFVATFCEAPAAGAGGKAAVALSEGDGRMIPITVSGRAANGFSGTYGYASAGL